MPGLDIEVQVGPLIRDSPIPKEQLQSKKARRRNTELDPLILAAAFASGPHITRNHHLHDAFPVVGDPQAESAWDWTKWTGEDASSPKRDPKRRSYHSQQAPRRQRLRSLGLPVDPEPQVETLSLKTQAKSPRPNIGNETDPNKRACCVHTIK